jgi:hypothetical protein
MITGSRVYPVRHYPIAIRLRTRKRCAVLCVALFPQSEGLFGRNTRSAFRRTPSRCSCVCAFYWRTQIIRQ